MWSVKMKNTPENYDERLLNPFPGSLGRLNSAMYINGLRERTFNSQVKVRISDRPNRILGQLPPGQLPPRITTTRKLPPRTINPRQLPS